MNQREESDGACLFRGHSFATLLNSQIRFRNRLLRWQSCPQHAHQPQRHVFGRHVHKTPYHLVQSCKRCRAFLGGELFFRRLLKMRARGAQKRADRDANGLCRRGSEIQVLEDFSTVGKLIVDVPVHVMVSCSWGLLIAACGGGAVVCRVSSPHDAESLSAHFSEEAQRKEAVAR